MNKTRKINITIPTISQTIKRMRWSWRTKLLFWKTQCSSDSKTRVIFTREDQSTTLLFALLGRIGMDNLG